jgi:hypothetical protein
VGGGDELKVYTAMGALRRTTISDYDFLISLITEQMSETAGTDFRRGKTTGETQFPAQVFCFKEYILMWSDGSLFISLADSHFFLRVFFLMYTCSDFELNFSIYFVFYTSLLFLVWRLVSLLILTFQESYYE